jgi:hypothetical protein
MTRLKTGAIAMTLSMFALAGCQASEPGPYHEWFNPSGVRASDQVPDTCPAGEVPAAPSVLPPLSAPPGVAEGYSFATVDLRVEALVVQVDDGDPVDNLCVPVSVHAYVTVNGTSAPITVTDAQGIRVVPTPWDALRDTPYSATGLIAWKNTLPSGPVINIDWSARYEAELDQVKRGNAVVGLACTVFVNGVALTRTISLDVNKTAGTVGGAHGAVTGPFVQCRPPAFTARAALR